MYFKTNNKLNQIISKQSKEIGDLEDKINSYERQLTLLVQDDEKYQERIIKQAKEIEKLEEENKLLDQRLEKIKQYIDRYPVNACHELLDILKD